MKKVFEIITYSVLAILGVCAIITVLALVSAWICHIIGLNKTQPGFIFVTIGIMVTGGAAIIAWIIRGIENE